MKRAYEISGFKSQQEKLEVAFWLGRHKLSYTFNSPQNPAFIETTTELFPKAKPCGDIVAPDMEKEEVRELKTAYPDLRVKNTISVVMQVLY